MSISAKELAQKLNVSPATISMVLNHKPGISEETRDRVLSAAKKYGYDLTKYSYSLAETKNICFIIYKKNGQVVTDTPFFSDLTEGISNTCQTNGLSLSILYVYGNQAVEPQLKELYEKEYHGILLLATEMTQEDFLPFQNLPCPDYQHPVIIFRKSCHRLNHRLILSCKPSEIAGHAAYRIEPPSMNFPACKPP